MLQTKYVRLTLKEREEIYHMLLNGFSFREVAKVLDRNVSTISREVNNAQSSRTTYRVTTSNNKAIRSARNRKTAKFKISSNAQLKNFIHEKIRTYWSPQQIATVLKKKYPNCEKMNVTHETIYNYLFVQTKGDLKKELLSFLRCNRKRRRPQGRKTKQRRPLEDMVMIDARPPEIMSRAVPGHWEGDLIIGKNRQSALGTLVERKTRFAILVALKGRTAEEVRKAFAKEINKLPQHLKLSLTYDQGREMAEHKLLTRDTKMQVYFCHPASPWERGTNENTNGLVRQFFPKGTDFNTIKPKEIKRAQHLLNGRPRKTLDFETPYEVYQKVLR